MAKSIFSIQPIDPFADPADPLGGYWALRTKNHHAVFCVAPDPGTFLPARMYSLSLEAVQQMRYFEGDTNNFSLEITLASGSVYELTVNPQNTSAPAPFVATIAGPCCDDPYPVP